MKSKKDLELTKQKLVKDTIRWDKDKGVIWRKYLNFHLFHINHVCGCLFLAKFSSKKTIKFNMNNLISQDFQQAMQILGVFVGLYAIIFGLLLGTDQPKLKKQK